MNSSIEGFVAHALQRNLPLKVVNHRTGAHGFDLDDETETAMHAIRQVLSFLQYNTSTP